MDALRWNIQITVENTAIRGTLRGWCCRLSDKPSSLLVSSKQKFVYLIWSMWAGFVPE
jgi:hypothetical protein